MYSLGVVLFEMWYPFGTSMERYVVLNDLKQKGVLPSSWATEFVQQCGLVKWLMAPDPSHRPSAVQVLRSEFLPPRMEDESLNGSPVGPTSSSAHFVGGVVSCKLSC